MRPNKILLNVFFLVLAGFICINSTAQSIEKPSQQPGQQFFIPSDSLNKIRLYAAGGLGLSVYGFGSAALYNAWYKNHEQSQFHLFNDAKEWQQMDKMGHIFSAYFEANWTYELAKWTGLSKKQAMWSAFTTSSLIQLSIEMMDGFSAKWGFSIPDMAANLTGSGLFLIQQHYWNEQILKMKFSTSYRYYSCSPIHAVNSERISSLKLRAKQLYGQQLGERILKDYNAQHYWLSINLEALTPGNQSWLPDWLDLSLGYSADNLFGGFDNNWIDNDALYILDELSYPRYRQYFLSFDIDFNRIKVKNPALKTFFKMIQIVKVPFPGIEYNSLNKWKWHWMVF